MCMCPDCNEKVFKVKQSENSMLNREQFDAAKAGDWFCVKCASDVSHTGYKYFWDNEVIK